MKQITNIKYIVSIVLVGVVLSGGFSSCQLVNKYKSPEMDTDNLFRDKISEDTTTIASLSWKEYFTDPFLQSFITEGLENNYDMLIAAERIKQAETQLNVAKLAYFPDFALVGNVTHNRYSLDQGGVKNTLGYKTNKYSLGIASTWELDVWGKINREHRGEKAQYLASLESKNLVQTSLISNIATIYYSLMALDEQLFVTHEMIQILQESTKTMEAMMEAGLLNAAAVEQSKALLYGTQVTVPDLEYNIRQLENSLCLLLGRKPGSLTRNKLEVQAVPQQLAFGVPAQMLSNRPDVKAAELNFRSAFELTNAARASFYPSISLSTGSMFGWGAASLSNFFKPENLFANIIGGLTQPLFARGQLKGQLEIAKAEQEIALIQFEQSVVSAGIEVSDILFQFEKSLSKNGNRSKQVKSLETSVDFTQELLLAGEATYTEVLNAEQSLLQAQLGQVSDKLEQLQCSVNLYRALGGGVE